MIEFTDKEISLCKQVAEKYRKEIKKGNWVIEENRANIPLLVIDTIGNDLILSLGNIAHSDTHSKNCIPLWTISDCLEFLIKKGYYRIDIVALEGRFVLWLVHENTDKCYEPDGDTILEACLKAVWAVLEEEK